jgi:hypothetical protein
MMNSTKNTLLIGLVISALCMTACAKRPSLPAVMPDTLDLQALAAEIDPGPLDSLLDSMPGWLEASMTSGVEQRLGPQAYYDQAKQIITDWKDDIPDLSLDNLKLMLELVRGFFIMERFAQSGAKCDLDCLTVRATIYNTLDVPMFADREGFFGQIFSFMSSALTDDILSQGQASELLNFVHEVFTKAPLHQRHFAAKILRQAPQSEQAVKILYQLSGRAADKQDFDRAKRLQNAAMQRSHEPLNADNWFSLTGYCYRDLDPACGNKALANAKKVLGDEISDEQKKTLTNLEQAATWARQLMEMKEVSSLTSKLKKAGIAFELGRTQEAGQIYTRLKNDHPNDARPYTGLARVALATNLNTTKTVRLIKQAANLENKDLEYYQVAVGTAWGTFIKEVLGPGMKDPDRLLEYMEPFLKTTRKDIDGLAKFDPKRAAILALMVDAGTSIIMASKQEDNPDRRKLSEQIVLSAINEAGLLKAKYPSEPDIYRMIWMLTRFQNDKKLAFSLALEEPPAGVEELAELNTLRAQVLYILMVDFNDATQLPSLLALVESLPKDAEKNFEAANLEADVLSLKARIAQDKAIWAQVEQAYRKLLKHCKSEHCPRLHNNLGVALYEQGNVSDALASWNDSLEAGAEYEAANINRLIAKPDGVTTAKLEAYGRNAGLTSLRYHAGAWAIHRSALDKKEVGRRLKELEKELFDEVYLGQPSNGYMGSAMDGAFQVGFGYSTVEHLVINFEMTPNTWLVLPSPIIK